MSKSNIISLWATRYNEEGEYDFTQSIEEKEEFELQIRKGMTHFNPDNENFR